MVSGFTHYGGMIFSTSIGLKPEFLLVAEQDI